MNWIMMLVDDILNILVVVRFIYMAVFIFYYLNMTMLFLFNLCPKVSVCFMFSQSMQCWVGGGSEDGPHSLYWHRCPWHIEDTTLQWHLLGQFLCDLGTDCGGEKPLGSQCRGPNMTTCFFNLLRESLFETNSSIYY